MAEDRVLCKGTNWTVIYSAHKSHFQSVNKQHRHWINMSGKT